MDNVRTIYLNDCRGLTGAAALARGGTAIVTELISR
jgi:hypothetical protein